MDIDFVFAYNIKNTSLILREPENERINSYSKSIIKSFKKLDYKKIVVFKRIEIKFGKTKKKIYMIKFDEKYILGVFCKITNKEDKIFHFLDEFYLKFIKESFPIKKNSKIYKWLKIEIIELKKGERKSVYDFNRSYRSISRSRSKSLPGSNPKSEKNLKIDMTFLMKLEKEEKKRKMSFKVSETENEKKNFVNERPKLLDYSFYFFILFLMINIALGYLFYINVFRK